MTDPNDRYKFEWLDPKSKTDQNVKTGIRVVLAAAFAIFLLMALIFLRSPKPIPPDIPIDEVEEEAIP